MMRKTGYYILTVLFFLSGCITSNELPEKEQEHYISIRIAPVNNFQTRVVDEDNLASEQTINNISLFFTEPSTTTITDKYVYTGFTVSGDYQLISLPLQPTDLLTKDIYVVANYNNESTLNGLTTITQLQDLHTPEVNKTNNLNPQNGFCMSGSLLNFDFTDPDAQPAIIGLTRTCAKLRINLTFPENPALSSNNSFLIQGAASYTYVIKNATQVLPQSDYFNFAAALPLTNNGSATYTNITYVYEAAQPPLITLYTNFYNAPTQQEFTATLPHPVRNYLYDINIEVHEGDTNTTRNSIHNTGALYSYTTTIKVYNENSELTDTYTTKKELPVAMIY